jgi:carboxypeptidase Taq
MPESRRPQEFGELLSLWAEIDDLENVTSILNWDEQTKMPRGGAEARADHKATVQRILHQKLSSPKIGRLLESLVSYQASIPYDTDEAGMLRAAKRAYDRATKVPENLVLEMSRTGSKGFATWLRAREAKDFSVFSGDLERIVDVMGKVASALGYEDTPVDALLDQREPGMKVADLERLFGSLRERLVPLAKRIFERIDAVDDSVIRQAFDIPGQWKAGLMAVRAIGFNLDQYGRADTSVHPFSTTFSPHDVRITTRFMESFLPTSLFAFLHEAGHGQYMQGIPVKFRRTPISRQCSAGFSESQSRMWENLVGRSRHFSKYLLPRLREVFPGQLASANVETWYRAVNRVRPSLIRVEADEVTYNLHIMLRFELEKDVFAGRVKVKDLAGAWNSKFKEYLGIEPPNDLLGVLQDIHWSRQFGACFQGYTLGNVISAQLFESALLAHPSIPEQFEVGNCSALLEWTRQNVHAHGSKYTPQELIVKATGRPLSTEPYLSYIERKYKDIYGL